MVAIVSGNSLGLSLTSLATLGQRGVFGSAGTGRDGGLVYVNAANGNLVLQSRDELLAGRGRDATSVRTYNSQGQLTDDNGDNWSNGIFLQQLQLNGTRNTAGSTLVRTDRDGAQAVYTYDADAGHYVSSAGAGAFDTIAYDGANDQFAWTDGNTGEVERYDAATGRLLSVTDTTGNTLGYTYDASGRLARMETASGESIFIDYTGSNISQLRVVRATDAGTETVTTTRYTYDAQNRLSSVIVDLSPEDNSVTDNDVYVTSYTYEGASERVATISQTDGSSLAISYVLVNGEYRVETLTNALGEVTRFDYDTVNHRTTVTDPLQLRTVYAYDGAGQLLSVTAPAVNGVSQVTSYAYDADGNLTGVTDPANRTVTMGYDERGNLTTQRDSAGNTITRVYDEHNQLISETVYAVPDSDGAGPAQPSAPATSRFVYDAAGRNQLRFAITAAGDVTEYRYDAQGNQVETLQYGYAPLDVSALGAAQVPTELDMEFWARVQDPSRTGHVARTFDFRGQVSKERAFAVADETGMADALPVTTHYVYDSTGRLLTSIAADGGLSSYSYDGLGRVQTFTDANNVTTVSDYDDANRRTSVTLVSGLVTTSSYDAAGRLVAVVQGSDATGQLGETRYRYDADGRLLMSTDPTGVSRWSLYDNAGRKTADIDADGTLTEYVYHANNLLAGTIVHATRVNTAQLVNAAGEPTNPALASIRPADSAQDQREWRVYDQANRLVQVIDALGYVTQTAYDGVSRVISVTRYATHIDVPATGLSPFTVPVAVTANAAADRVTRSFYDVDGRVIGELDAENYYTHYEYDAAGRLTAKTRYASPMVGALVDARTPPMLIAEGAAAPATAYVRRRATTTNPTLPANVGDGKTGVVDAKSLLARLEAFKAVDIDGAFRDLVGLVRNAHVTLLSAGFDGVALLRQWVAQLPAGSPVFATLSALHVQVGASTILGGSDQPGEEGALLIGGPGVETLYGTSGNDTLGGADFLEGGSGSNVYLFGYGDGEVTANITIGEDGIARDSVQLRPGITPADIELSGDPGFLEITLVATGDKLTLQDEIHELRFADGTVWRNEDFAQRLDAGGPSGGNHGASGSGNMNVIRGQGGGDWLSGAGGNDLIAGGAGNDNLTGGSGHDLLLGGDGNDEIFGGADRWWDSEPWNDRDTIDGGAGDDRISGGFGNDFYTFGYGSGRDTIDGMDGYQVDRWENADTLQLKAGITPEHLFFSREGDDLRISLRDSSDYIQVARYFSEIETEDDWYGGFARGLEYIEFADGTRWDAQTIQAQLDPKYQMGQNNSDDLIYGTEGSDYLIGRSGRDTLDGGAGNDTLSGNGDDDTFVFGIGSGVDVINPGWTWGDVLELGVPSTWNQLSFTKVGDDLHVRISERDVAIIRRGQIGTIKFYDGVTMSPSEVEALTTSATDDADVIDAPYAWGGQRIDGKGGADSLGGGDYSKDTLLGGAGADTLDGRGMDDDLAGGRGRDLLIGGNGKDTYRFERGDGADTIDNESAEAGTVGVNNGDKLVFGAEIKPEDLRLTRDGNDLVLSLVGSDDTIRLRRYFSYETPGQPDIRLSAITFANGQSWSPYEVAQRLSTPESTIDNDTWTASSGVDFFPFDAGSGSDTIVGFDTSSTMPDRIQVGPGISPTNLKVIRNGEDLLLVVPYTRDSLSVPGYFAGRDLTLDPSLAMPEVFFDDGSTWTLADVISRSKMSSEGDDRIEAFGPSDASLQGMGGDDTLIGGAGNDTLTGGRGDDRLDGGAGNDTYLFGWGAGQDTIVAGGAANGDVDAVRLDPYVRPSDVHLAVRGRSLIVSLKTSKDRLVIESLLNDGTQGPLQIQELRFEDGTIWDLAAILAKATTGADGDIQIEGFDFADTLKGSALGETLSGFDGDDLILGGRGNDTIDGGDGNDTIDGGGDDDLYIASAGTDIYRLGRGSGHDRLDRPDGQVGQEIVEIAAGLKPSDVVIYRDEEGRHLVQLVGSGDRIEFGQWLPTEIRFADGTVWDQAAMAAEMANHSAWELGMPALGADVFDAASGQAIPAFGFGAGQDTIRNLSNAGAGFVIQIGADVGPDDLLALASRDNPSTLMLRIKGTKDALSLPSYLDEGAGALPNIRFADGTEWTAAQMRQRVQDGYRGTGPVLTSAVSEGAAQLVLRQVGDALEIVGGSGNAPVRIEGWYGSAAGHVEQFMVNGNSLMTAAASGQAAQQGRDQTTHLIYDALGRLVGEVDAENYLTEYVYNDAGQKSSAIRYSRPLTAEVRAGDTLLDLRPSGDSAAQVTRWTYDMLGRLGDEVNAEGAETVYLYDAVGNLVMTRRAESSEERRVGNARYDVQGRLVGELSGEGSALLESGQEWTEEQIHGIWSQYGIVHTYDAAGRRTSTTDANGNRTLFYYDVDGRMRFTVNAEGEVQEQRYNALNQLDKTIVLANRLSAPTLSGLRGGVVDAGLEQLIGGSYDLVRDTVTGYAYTVRGQLDTTTNALSQTSSVDYNAFGEAEHTTATDGLKTDIVRDRRGQATSTVTDPAGKHFVTTAQYDAFGRLTRSVDAAGKVTSQSYDRLGRVVQTFDPNYTRRTTTWDAFDRKLSQTDALGNTTTFAYNDRQRSMIVTTPEGVKVTTRHNLHGQTSEVIDAAGNSTTYEYDHDGHLKTTTDANQKSSTSEYDKAGRLISTTDANGQKVVYGYDHANRVLTRTVDPEGLALVTSYGYDAKGQTVSVTDANLVVTTTEYDVLGRVFKQIVDPDGLHIETSYGYDEAGRTKTVVDANRVTTKYEYDSLGRRTAEVRDPDGLNLRKTYEYDTSGNVLVTEIADAATGEVRQVKSVYDVLNRPVLVRDAAGGLTYVEYDAEGRVLRSTQLAQTVTVAALNGVTSEAAAALVASLRLPDEDRVTTNRYDRDGRLRFSVDGTGAVVELRYDERGNVSDRIAYANRIDLSTWDGVSDPVIDENASVDHHIRTSYDKLGRVKYVADALGYVTENVYDDVGQLKSQTVHAIPIGQDAESLTPPNDALHDRTTSYVYDKAGRLKEVTDAIGAVTRNTYDGNGNLIEQTKLAWTNPAWTVSDLRNITPGQDRTTRTKYDAANRAVYVADAEGHVTTTAYDGLGHVLSTTRWFNKPTVAGELPAADASKDQTTGFTYDAAGRLKTTTDALGKSESYGYNAFGDKTSFTNKKGSTWNYEYDGSGRLTVEISPEVTTTSVALDDKRDLYETETGTYRLRTVLTYDGTGNLTSRTEAQGRPEQRQTVYLYDAMGRQTGVIYPEAPIYSETPNAALYNGATGVAGRTEEVRALRTSTTYDAFGNAVSNVDVAGNTSYKLYDRANRVVYDIDAMGYATKYKRDGFGDAIEVTRFSGKSKTVESGEQPWDESDESGQLPPAGQQPIDVPLPTDLTIDALDAWATGVASRTVTTVYDKLGRAVRVTEGAAFVVREELYSTPKTDNFGKTTVNTYDGFGNLIRVTQLLSNERFDDIDSYQYFDVMGRVIDQIDVDGHRTSTTYDAFGNVESKKEWAGNYRGFMPGGEYAYFYDDEASPDDRLVVFAYDQLNRKTSETRKDVVFSTAGEAVLGTSHRGDVTTSYSYDAVGNLTATTDALGGKTYSYYDALGRVTAVAAPTRATAPGASTTLTPVTLFRRDAYGNVVVTVELVNGSQGVVEQFDGVSNGTQLARLVGSFSSEDGQTFASYDLYGHALQTTDAERHSSFTSYNARGQVAKTWHGVTTGARQYENGTDETGGNPGKIIEDSTVFKLYEYDKLGQLVRTYDPGPLNKLVTTGMPGANGGVTESTIVESSTVGWGESGPPSDEGGPTQVKEFYSGNSVRVSWVDLVNPALGDVRIEIDYATSNDDGHAPVDRSYAQVFGAGDSRRTVMLSWNDSDPNGPHGISAIKAVRAQQMINGVWTTVWDSNTVDTPSDAEGSTTTGVAYRTLTRTDLSYNAYGELVRKGIDGGEQEYFDYDEVGRLWRTNSGDGIDKIYLYDSLGHTVQELRSDGSGGKDRNVRGIATAKAAYELGDDLRSTKYEYSYGGELFRTQGARREVAASVPTVHGRVDAVGASVTGSAAIAYTEAGETSWTGTNSVSASWPDLGHLGDGAVKVEIVYTTAVREARPGMMNESEYVGGYTPAEVRTIDAVFSGAEAANGATVSWYEDTPAAWGSEGTGGVHFYAGGLGSVNAVRVYKRDQYGDWQLVEDSSAGPRKMLDVDKVADSSQWVTLQVRPIGGTEDDWTYFDGPQQNFLQVTRYDVTSLGDAGYEFRLVSDIENKSTVLTAGVVHGDGSSETTYTLKNLFVRPTTTTGHDRWGNATWTDDARNQEWQTTYKYNANNQVISEQKPSSNPELPGPTTEVFYDALGRQVGIRDANGNLNTMVYDAGGNLIEEHHADGGIVKHTYDALGNKIRTVNAEGNRAGLNPSNQEDLAKILANTTDYTYDKMHRLVETRHGAVDVARVIDSGGSDGAMVVQTERVWLVDRNEYDQAGRRLTQVVGSYGSNPGEVTRYKYDYADRVIETIQPGGGEFRTRTVYDMLGHKTAEVDQNGNAVTWNYDYFGLLLSRTDLGGKKFDYSYDNARQLTTTKNSRYSTESAQLINTYNSAGQLKTITDNSLGQVTEYWYDLSGKHVREKTSQGGDDYQDNLMAYDELGRLRHVSDGRMSIDIDYDAVGNRIHQHTHTNVPTLADPTVDVPKDSDVWFTYDKMNRQTGAELDRRVDGSGNVTYDFFYKYDANGRIQFGTSGHKIGYDLNGNRISDTYLGTKVRFVPAFFPGHIEQDPEWSDPDHGLPGRYVVDSNPSSWEVTETYQYDALNRLTNAKRDGVTVDVRRYDAAGRVVASGPEGLSQTYAEAINSGAPQGDTIGKEYRVSKYDSNGRLVRQQTFNAQATKMESDIQYTLYDKAGNVQAYTLRVPGEYTNQYTYTRELYDGYKEKSLRGTSDKFEPGETISHYDVNGNLIRIEDKTKSENNRTFVNDVSGRALYVKQGNAVQRQVVVNGEVLGRYGVGINEMKPKDNNGNPNFIELADFSTGYQKITGSYPAASVGSYQVKAGDTLRSIARASYGDEGLWYRIAETNGLSGDRDLRVGQTITIPSSVGAVRNNTGTYQPYDPSKITGDTSPNMPMPPSKHGCGGLGMILTIVVAAVATVFTAGVAAVAMGASGGFFAAGAAAFTAGTLSGVAAVAIGAAVGSIVSQGFAIAIGAQEEFSWKQVGLSALGSAATAALPVGAFTGAVGSQAGGMAVRAAVGNAIGQGIGVATGLQERFNWRGVAASAAGTFVSESLKDLVMGGVSASTGKPTDGLVGVLGGTAAAKIAGSTVLGIAAGATAAVVRGGRVSVQQVAADAFGNALGKGISDAMESGFATQGVGPWSTADYQNGSDIESERAASRAATEALSRDFYNQLTGLMSTGAGSLPSGANNDILLAAGPGFSGIAMDRLTLGGRATDAAALDQVSRQTEARDRIAYLSDNIAKMTSALNGPGGTGSGRSDAQDGAITARLNRESVIRETVVAIAAADTARYAVAESVVVPDGSSSEPVDSGISVSEIASRFGQGLVGAAKAVTVEPVLQVRDMGAAALSVGYNELWRSGDEPRWYPEMKSGVAQAYDAGASRTRLLLQSNQITGIGVLTHDLTSAAMSQDWGAMAEMAGGVAGGFAIGKATAAYGGYGLRWAPSDVSAGAGAGFVPRSQRGATSLLNFELVAPGSGGKGSGRYTGNSELLKWRLAEEAGIPRNIDLNRPSNVWGLTAADLLTHYQLKGFSGSMQQAAKAKTSGKAKVFELDNHPTIESVQVHPGGGVHEGAYYKFTLHGKPEAVVNVIDPVTYKPRTIKPGATFYNPQGDRLVYQNRQWMSVDGGG